MARPRHELIPELLSTKKSVNDLTGAQPANDGFSGGHGPHNPHPAQMPLAMDVRCKPCWLADSAMTDINTDLVSVQ